MSVDKKQTAFAVCFRFVNKWYEQTVALLLFEIISG